MTDDHDAEVFEIFSSQAWKNVEVDLVLAERRLVSLEPEVSQPSRNIHPPSPFRFPSAAQIQNISKAGQDSQSSTRHARRVNDCFWHNSSFADHRISTAIEG